MLVSYDVNAITYDAIGNPTSYMGASMSWFGRQLVSYTKGSTNVDYTYNADGLRVSKTVNGVTHNYYYVEGKLVYENCPSYELFYEYDAMGNLAGIKRMQNGTPTTYGVQCNARGDVIAIFNSSKSLLAKYTYDSWGKLLSITNASGTDISAQNNIWTQNSIRYRGYVYDTETKLYYLQSRYYDPETCRFINADTTRYLVADGGLNSFNLYSYCYNNPIRMADYDGTTPIDVLSLFDFRSIHQRVQEECQNLYGWEIEVYVKGEKDRGYLDLLDVETNQYYEVKSLRASQRSRTARQMNKYDVATIQRSALNLLKSKVQIGASVSRGTAIISGSFSHNVFDVKYYSLANLANGLIVYEATPNPARVAALSSIAVAVGLSLLLPEAAPVFAPMLSPVMQMLMS